MKDIYQYQQLFKIDRVQSVELLIPVGFAPIEIPFLSTPDLAGKKIFALQCHCDATPITTTPSGFPIVNIATFERSYLILRDKNKREIFKRLPLANGFLFSTSASEVYSQFLIEDQVIDWDNSSVLIASNVSTALPAGQAFLFTVHYHEQNYFDMIKSKLSNLKQYLNAPR
jgi:hypothetical protein